MPRGAPGPGAEGRQDGAPVRLRSYGDPAAEQGEVWREGARLVEGGGMGDRKVEVKPSVMIMLVASCYAFRES